MRRRHYISVAKEITERTCAVRCRMFVISFSKLKELQDGLTALAGGMVLKLVEGQSEPGRGKGMYIIF